MTHVRGALAAALALLACCATPAGRSSNTGAERFDALVRHVPLGMESLMLVEIGPELAFLAALEPPPCRMVWAGRKFRIPTDTTELVIITQWPASVPPGWDRSEVPGAEIQQVGGKRTLFVPSYQSYLSAGHGTWTLELSAGVLVSASRRELLEQVLAVPGYSAEQYAASLLASAEVPWDASLLIFRRYDRSNQEDLYSPFGRETLAGPVPLQFDITGFWLTLQPILGEPGWTIRLNAVTTDPEKSRAWFGAFGLGNDPWCVLEGHRVIRNDFEDRTLVIAQTVAPFTDFTAPFLITALFGFNWFL